MTTQAATYMFKNVSTGEFLLAPFRSGVLDTDDAWGALKRRGTYVAMVAWLEERLGDGSESYELVQWA
jgi:hypothetical protein